MSVVTALFPPETVDVVVEECGVREQRRRQLPADVTVHYTTGLRLWPDLNYVEVFKQMTDTLRAPRWHAGLDDFFDEVPGAGSIAKARDRIGHEVMKRLFETATGPVDPAVEEVVGWHGLRIVAVDGDTLDGRGLPANTVRSRGRRRSEEPGRCSVGRPRRQREGLVRGADRPRRVRSGQVAVFDRGFAGHDLFAKVRAIGADLVMRVTSRLTLPVIEVLPDGSWRSELCAKGKAPIPVRVAALYSVTARDRVCGAETMGETITLVADLFDTVAYPIEDLPDLHGARWRVEEIFDEIKTDLRGGTEVVFRSRTHFRRGPGRVASCVSTMPSAIWSGTSR